MQKGTTIFTPVGNRETLSKTVASRIEEAIRSRKLPDGVRIPSELELCDQFGVSRTAVREALRMLSARGLVTVVKGKGVFVKGMSADHVTNPMHLYLQLKSERNYVLDVVHARQIIEPPIAAAAAARHTREDLERLEHDIEELRASTGEFGGLAKLDMAFHLDIARASQNPIMPLLLDPIHRLMPDIKSSVYATVKDAKDSALVWHQKIYRQIKERRADGARDAMTEHLKIAEHHVKKMLRAARLAKQD